MGLGGAKPASTPVEANVKLISLQYDAHVGKNTTEPSD